MDSIRIKNLRSIVDSGEIKLSKINILLGRNSSGKSSFLRLFPLLKETSRHELRGPILWFDENYDFGDFSNTLSRHAQGDKDIISIAFTWTLEGASYREFYPSLWEPQNMKKSKENKQVKVEIGISNYNQSTFFRYIHLNIWDHLFLLENDAPNSPIKLTMDGTTLMHGEYRWNYSSNGILPELSQLTDFTVFDDLTKSFQQLFGKDAIKFDQVFLLSRLYLIDANSIKSTIQSFLKERGISIASKVFETEEFKAIVDLIIWMNLSRLLYYLDHDLSDYFNHSYYITPLRYNFLRYMRNRDLAVEYVDSTGKNVMEYILSLNEKEKASYIEYIQDTLGIVIDVEGDENKSIFITMSDGEKDNIVDVGYGYSQVLPIATILWDRAYKRESKSQENTIVIEQPEVHLHPAMQKKLARLFVKALNLSKKRGHKLTLIVETHSSALINKLGHYVQNNNSPTVPELLEYYQIDNEPDVKISNDDISVYLFDKQNGITHISKSAYDNSGRIIQWPIGFLD